MSEKKENWFKKNVVSLVPALLLVLVIRSSVIEAFKIPSGSMTPTLLVGDHLFVNKMSYGLRVPLLELFSDHATYFFRTSGPDRGDIIVFKSPEEDVYLIKRVIGLPGETVEMKNKVIYINGQAIPRTAFAENELPATYETMKDFPLEYPPSRMRLYHDQYTHTVGTVMIDTEATFSIDMAAVKIPEGQYFVMGDNRDNSKDSRFIGFIPFDTIKGRAFVIWSSFWVDFSLSQYFFHPERTGKILH